MRALKASGSASRASSPKKLNSPFSDSASRPSRNRRRNAFDNAWRVDGQEPVMRRERWTSGRLVAKSIFIKDAKRRFGNCARKATELTPGGLLRVPTSELRASQGVLTADAEVSRGHIRPSSRQG